MSTAFVSPRREKGRTPKSAYRSRSTYVAGGMSEKAIQAAIVKLLLTLGAKVYVSGTTRAKGDYQGTRQTPGIPDVEAWLRVGHCEGPRRRLLKIECKTARGRLTPAQTEYRQCCLDAGIDHLVGGLDEVIAWLTRERYLR